MAISAWTRCLSKKRNQKKRAGAQGLLFAQQSQANCVVPPLLPPPWRITPSLLALPRYSYIYVFKGVSIFLSISIPTYIYWCTAHAWMFAPTLPQALPPFFWWWHMCIWVHTHTGRSTHGGHTRPPSCTPGTSMTMSEKAVIVRIIAIMMLLEKLAKIWCVSMCVYVCLCLLPVANINSQTWSNTYTHTRREKIYRCCYK